MLKSEIMRVSILVLTSVRIVRLRGCTAFLLALLLPVGVRAQLAPDPATEGDETEIVQPPTMLPPAGPLVLLCPADITAPACASGPVSVRFADPTVRGDCAASATVTCTPPSGSLFSPGRTVVECVAFNDCRERVTCRFVVQVIADTASPTIQCPSNKLVYSTNPEGAVVHFSPPQAADDADPEVRTICEPPSGSFFPRGFTRVNCVATDACGRTGTCQFTVEVRRPSVGIDVVKGQAALSVDGDNDVDVADELGGGWEPVVMPPTGGPLFEDLRRQRTRFYRPGILEGVKRGPTGGQVVYTVVGLNPVYFTPGVSFKFGVGDLETGFDAALLLSGASGGTGVNRWSEVKSLPFTFYLYGQGFRHFCVSKNGLLTFTTAVAGQPLTAFNQAPTNSLPLAELPDYTIACFAGKYLAQTDGDDGVRAWVNGAAPFRQVYIKFIHPKEQYGLTGTGIMLEETSNKIYIVDGFIQNFISAGNPNLIVGIQGTNQACQLPVSPKVALVNTRVGSFENDYYLFKPYVMGQPVNGQGAAGYAAIDGYVAPRMQNRSFPGLQVAITKNGRLVFSRGYGFASVEKGTQMQPWHRCSIGSSSKLLTAAGIFKLIEQGQLSDVTAKANTSQLLGKPWFWDGVLEGVEKGKYTTSMLNVISNVTLQHLMTMTAAYGGSSDALQAILEYANGDYAQFDQPMGIRWFMAHTTPNASQNGVFYEYSNNSYSQLGQLIVERTGQTLEHYIQKNVLAGIGPHHMRVMRLKENEDTERDARRYLYYKSGIPHGTNFYTGELTQTTYGFNNYPLGAATGGWTSSAEDLCRLLAAMDQLPNRPDVLSAASLKEMERVPFKDATGGVNQAYCWRSEYSDGHIEKGGNIGYGSSFMRRENGPDKLTVVLVSNTDTGSLPAMTLAIANLVREVAVSPFYDLWSELKLAGE